jgi:hypothetical protein
LNRKLVHKQSDIEKEMAPANNRKIRKHNQYLPENFEISATESKSNVDFKSKLIEHFELQK